jgi:hypothetical protein
MGVDTYLGNPFVDCGDHRSKRQHTPSKDPTDTMVPTMVGASTTPLLPPLLPSAKKSPKRRFRPIGRIRAPNVTAPTPKKHRSLLELSTKSTDDTTCESLNNEAVNLNEEDDMDGGKNVVDEGEEINIGRNCVSRDDQKVIPKLMNVDQHSTRHYPMVSNMMDSESDVNTNDIVSKSNASTSVKLVATSSDVIRDSRKKKDATLKDDSLVPTVTYTPKPLTTSKRSVDATPNDTRNAVSITVPNIKAPVPKKDQPLLEFSTKSVDDTACKSLNNEGAHEWK